VAVAKKKKAAEEEGAAKKQVETDRREDERHRADVALSLASVFWHLTQDNGVGPAERDVLGMIMHRLRDVLRDGPCPACMEIALGKQLDSDMRRDIPAEAKK